MISDSSILINKMKNKVMMALPFIMLFSFLIVMYGTNADIPGITQYWKEFELLDMQWSYSIDTYRKTIDSIGVDGVRHYMYYF